MSNSIFLKRDEELTEPNNVKYEIMILLVFYERSLAFVSRVSADRYETNNTKKEGVDYIEIKTLRDQIQITTNEFNLTELEIDNIIKKYFVDKSINSINTTMISLDLFFKFFVLNDSQFSIKIIANTFINFSMKKIELIYNWIENKAMYHFDSIDIGKREFLVFIEFEKLIMTIFGDSDNKWKVSDYYR